MKKAIFIVLVFVLVSYMATVAQAHNNLSIISVKIDGKEINFDTPPIIENGRTLVPMRAIFESLGAKVIYQAENNTVIAHKDSTEIILPIGKFQATVNGQVYNLEVPPRIINNRTLVPVRFVSEALGTDVVWDEKYNVVIINSKLETLKEAQKATVEPDVWTIESANDSFNQNLIYYLNGHVASKVYYSQNVSYVTIVSESVYSTVYIPSKNLHYINVGDVANLTFTGKKVVKKFEFTDAKGNRMEFYSEKEPVLSPKRDIPGITSPGIYIPPGLKNPADHRNDPNYKVISGIVEYVNPPNLKLVGNESIYVDYTGRNLFENIHVGDIVEIDFRKSESTENWDFVGISTTHPENLPPG